jgi:2-polyprenyl-3-methyl-5-hydroxy-6-metoxy-1,4-benzoquinol methylase
MAAMEAVEHAVAEVSRRFPFPGYIEASPRGAHQIAEAVQRVLPAGASILDWGAGPCDKTAVLQALGYRCTAFDDLSDPWHTADGNRAKILEFAAQEGIAYRLASGGESLGGPFDMVMLHDVMEHLHDSPRPLLVDLLQRTHDGGYLFLTVPNAGNARKRLDVLRGRTNLPSFPFYFWYEGTWRGHVREYVRDDLCQLAAFLDLEIVELRGVHHLAHRLPLHVRLPYTALTRVFDGLRDSWMLIARKPPGWQAPDAPAPELARRLLLDASPYWATVDADAVA